jgi:hypothetical protein
MDNLVWLKRMKEKATNSTLLHSEYVCGLHLRGMLYHFDDDALECGFPTEEATLMNYITDTLCHAGHQDTMFRLALRLINGETWTDSDL